MHRHSCGVVGLPSRGGSVDIVDNSGGVVKGRMIESLARHGLCSDSSADQSAESSVKQFGSSSVEGPFLLSCDPFAPHPLKILFDRVRKAV